MKEYLTGLLPTMLDSAGAYGSILNYSLTIAIVGSALLVFIYLWSKGRLDMDEEPKLQMMAEDMESHTKNTVSQAKNKESHESK